MATPTYLGLDVETTGLDPYTEGAALLEVGLVVFDENLDVIDTWTSLVYSDKADAHRREGMVHVVRDMHEENGLWAELDAADRDLITPDQVESKALEWLERSGVPKGLLMVGSSITLDRAFLAAEMPTLLSYFHYRSLDATSVMAAAEFGGCNLYKIRDAASQEDYTAHRAVSDTIRSANLVKAAVSSLKQTP